VGGEYAAEMRTVVEAASEGDVGDGPIRRLWSGQQPGGTVHALVPKNSHHGLPALGEDLVQEARGDAKVARYPGGGKVGVVETQRHQASSAGVEVGASRGWQATRLRDLGGVPGRSKRQSNQIVDVADGEPVRLRQHRAIVSQEETGVAGQQPDGSESTGIAVCVARSKSETARSLLSRE
jgi:hypothetical protein